MVVPWTLLVTFKPGAKMYFKVGGSMIIAVLKRPGDAVLFRGDVSHGGGCYKVEHWRFHFYWEPKDTIYKPLRGFPTYRHYVDEESGKATLALFNVEKHEDQPGGSALRETCAQQGPRGLLAVCRCGTDRAAHVGGV